MIIRELKFEALMLILIPRTKEEGPPIESARLPEYIIELRPVDTLATSAADTSCPLETDSIIFDPETTISYEALRLADDEQLAGCIGCPKPEACNEGTRQTHLQYHILLIEQQTCEACPQTLLSDETSGDEVDGNCGF